MTWFLQTVGIVSKDTFALVGSLLLTFAGLLKIINLKKGRKHSDHF
ncbi:hypothetical protein HYZ64_00575 [Candidatus Berkelbacteria bacterium]|nr:hypothetical protein [Candidatus Berkelbacteria bacterium]